MNTILKEEYLNSKIFKMPFACMLAGPSKSGKTTLLIQLLINKDIYDKQIDRIVYCYSQAQPSFEKLANIEFHKGLPDTETFDSGKNNIVILDDLMAEANDNIQILNLFTVDSHHRNISTFFLTQNLFAKGKYSRTISLNCNYIFLFNNPRDKSQIKPFAMQIANENWRYIKEAYDDATSEPYGYLFFDLHQKTPPLCQVQTDILSDQRVIYIPKNV